VLDKEFRVQLLEILPRNELNIFLIGKNTSQLFCLFYVQNYNKSVTLYTTEKIKSSIHENNIRIVKIKINNKNTTEINSSSKHIPKDYQSTLN
jgi:hypothetical protein